VTHRNSPPPRFVPRPPPGVGDTAMRRRDGGVVRRPPPGAPPRGLRRAVPGSHLAVAEKGGESGIAGGIRRALDEAKLKLLASKLKLQLSAALLRARLGSQK
jgi:hypothetical protein